MRSHNWGKIIRRERENRDWCVYTDLGLSCFFYCVSSDASGRSKSARNHVEKFERNSCRKLSTQDKKKKEKMRETLKELEMTRKRKCEREKEINVKREMTWD